MKDCADVVNAAIIRHNRILLVGKKYGGMEYLILPGGKRQERENDFECLEREVGEELSGAKTIINQRPYRSFAGTTPSGGQARVQVYFADLMNGSEVKPSKEITSATWSDYSLAIAQRNLSDITRAVLKSLHDDEKLY